MVLPGQYGRAGFQGVSWVSAPGDVRAIGRCNSHPHGGPTDIPIHIVTGDRRTQGFLQLGPSALRGSSRGGRRSCRISEPLVRRGASPALLPLTLRRTAHVVSGFAPARRAGHLRALGPGVGREAARSAAVHTEATRGRSTQFCPWVLPTHNLGGLTDSGS